MAEEWVGPMLDGLRSSLERQIQAAYQEADEGRSRNHLESAIGLIGEIEQLDPQASWTRPAAELIEFCSAKDGNLYRFWLESLGAQIMAQLPPG